MSKTDRAEEITAAAAGKTTAPSAVLHVGAPKCGSSSLQATLSRTPDASTLDGRPYSYVCITRSGKLERGLQLRARAQLSPYQFASSSTFSKDEDNEAVLSKAESELAKLVDRGCVPVLSSEGWINKARCFKSIGTPDTLGGDVHVSVFVRPPVDWINSAWWQWGTWSRASLDTFVQQKLRDVNWASHVRQWKSVPGVGSVSVRLMNQDIVPQFYAQLNAVPPASVRSNTALPPALMFYLQRNRKHRESSHAAETEFILGRHIAGSTRTSAPFVLSQEHVGAICGNLRDANAQLRSWLSTADQKAFDADPRWHTAAAYADKRISQAAEYETRESMIDLVKLMAKAAAKSSSATAELIRSIDQATSTNKLDHADSVVDRLIDRIVTKDRVTRARGLFGR